MTQKIFRLCSVGFAFSMSRGVGVVKNTKKTYVGMSLADFSRQLLYMVLWRVGGWHELRGRCYREGTKKGKAFLPSPFLGREMSYFFLLSLSPMRSFRIFSWVSALADLNPATIALLSLAGFPDASIASSFSVLREAIASAL